MPYKVCIADNFYYMDPDEIYVARAFDDLSEAVAYCRRRVDQCLDEFLASGISSAALWEHYVSFGEDPFIIVGTAEPRAPFSAWDHARERCASLCDGVGASGAPCGVSPERRGAGLD